MRKKSMIVFVNCKLRDCRASYVLSLIDTIVKYLFKYALSNDDVGLYFIENKEDGVHCRELKLAADGSVIDPIEEYKQFFSAAYNDAFATMLLKGTDS